MSIELLAIIGGLALLDTLSPATIGVTVYLLLMERRRRLGSRLFVYLSVVAGVYMAGIESGNRLLGTLSR